MKYFKVITAALFCLIFIGCTSSSYNERYSRPAEREHKSSKKARFSSDESESLTEIPSDNGPDTSSNNVYSDVSQQPEFDDEPVEEVKVNVDEFVNTNKIPQNMSMILTDREKILMEIIHYIDSPYKYGGTTEKGIDCSAFTQNVFHIAIGKDLPRSASQQFKEGERIVSESDLQFGDLVFFNTSRRAFPGHVGIYIGENLFAHASRSKGVIISSFDSDYYLKRFVGGKRLDLNLK